MYIYIHTYIRIYYVQEQNQTSMEPPKETCSPLYYLFEQGSFMSLLV